MTIQNGITNPARLPLVAPSILAADFAHMADDARASLDAGGDLLHIDVMDGHFVPNLTLGPALCAALRRNLPEALLDVHLMVTNPRDFVEAFAKAGCDHFTFHIEVEDDPVEFASVIHDLGMTAGLAINPPTSIDTILPFVEMMDLILVMSVNPGFGGQAFIDHVLEKVRQVRPMLRPDQRLQMDGGVGPSTVEACRDAGCDLLVAGSAIYGTSDYAKAIAVLHGDRAAEIASPG